MTEFNKKINFERKLTKDGKPNPKYVDLLDVDKPIAGQNFCCISFLSPEKILKDKNLFFFHQFLKKWEFLKSMEKFNQFLNFISYKYKINSEILLTDFEEFIKEEQDELIALSSIEADYKNFIDKYEDDITKVFNKEHDFQTNTRGVKVRGCFPTQEEAELRSKMLREVDPNFDIFVGPVGTWLMWDPEAYKTGRVEYMEEELNKLMLEKTKNEEKAKQVFEQRVKETKKKAIEENKLKAEKTGNALTQNIDDSGNLVGVNMTSQEKSFVVSGEETKDGITIEQIKKELFEGDNIVMDTKNTDYGLSSLTNKFGTNEPNNENNEQEETKL